MHTSKQISLNDFLIVDEKKGVEIDFDSFCPDYYSRDRIAIVNPFCNQGLLGGSRTIFAFTAAFYESLRSKQEPFFNYPQHFTLFIGGENPIPAEDCKPWTMLDVWPDSQWLHCANNVNSIIQTLFKLQVNRIIWPSEWKPMNSLTKLSDSLQKILLNRIDNVFFYNSKTSETRISISGKSYDLWHEAMSYAIDLQFDEQSCDYLHTGQPETLFSLCGLKTESF